MATPLPWKKFLCLELNFIFTWLVSWTAANSPLVWKYICFCWIILWCDLFWSKFSSPYLKIWWKIFFSEDVLKQENGECVICFENLSIGDTIARLPCLCIYHKRYFRSYFLVFCFKQPKSPLWFHISWLCGCQQ